MSLRTKFFALTYDRQMAKTEKAGLRAFRERLLVGASGDARDRRRDRRTCPATARRRVADDNRAARPDAAPPGAAGPASTARPPGSCARQPRTSFNDHSFDVAVSTLVLCGVDDQPGPCGSCAGCCAPAAGFCFIGHRGPATRARPACRTG